MKNGKASRAMEHLDEELILSAMDDSDRVGGRARIQERRKHMKKNVWTKWVAVAAMLAIVVTAGLLIGRFTVGATDTVIALDVNPSLEIEINGREKVREVRALNEDAVIVLGDMDLERVDLEVAINAIIGSMVKNGYISADQNSILVSINTKNEERANTLKDKLTGEINTLLGNSNIEASVITQTFTPDEETDKRADENKISAAKATLISKIVEAGLLDANGVPYTYEALAELKVHELKMILEARGMDNMDGWHCTGTAGKGDYIGGEAAFEKALADAGLTGDVVTRVEVEPDYDHRLRAMVYEVEFLHGEEKYEYEINASDGTVLEKEIEPADEDDREDHKPSKPTQTPEGALKREDALAIAYADAGAVPENVKRPEIELDSDDGVTVYEIEFKWNGMEYEYTIDAVSGAILDKETEESGSHDRDHGHGGKN